MVLLLLPTLPVCAYYHNTDSSAIFIIGILLMLVLIPLAKLLFYTFVALVLNKWTWIIGGVLLILGIMVYINKEQEKNGHHKISYPSSSQGQNNSTQMPYSNIRPPQNGSSSKEAKNRGI